VQSSTQSRRQPAWRGFVVLLSLTLLIVWQQPSPGVAWLARPWKPQGRRFLQVARRAVRPLVTERSEAFIRCVEEYNPDDWSLETDFRRGPPATGFRNLTECIRPFHPHPEWQIYKGEIGSFERDQKICGTYTLATDLLKDACRVLREDNEDGMRRMAPMIYEMREVLRFDTSKIAKEGGRRCVPFMGTCWRGLELPQGEVEQFAKLYKKGTEFVWPAFTSCQAYNEELGDGSLWPFDGNLNFEIECKIDPSKLKEPEVFAPVNIKRFIGGMHEVLFPPNTKFRVKEEKPVEKVTEHDVTRDVHTRILEVVELPTPQKTGGRFR